MFLLYGPNTNTSGGSIIVYLEAQSRLPAPGARAAAGAGRGRDRGAPPRSRRPATARCRRASRARPGRSATPGIATIAAGSWPTGRATCASTCSARRSSTWTSSSSCPLPERARDGRLGSGGEGHARLRDRGRGLRRLRARQPPLRGSLGARAAAGGRRQRPLAQHQDPGRVPEAVSHQARLGVRDRARAVCGRARALHPARQGAGRLELDERDALRARPAAGLRRLGGPGRHRLGLPRRAPILHEVRGQRARGVRLPRCGRTAAGQRAALAATAGSAPAGRQRGGGHPAHRRLQRAGAGRRVDVPGDPAQRTPLQRRRCVPAPGAARPNLEVRTGTTVLGVEFEGEPRGRRAAAQRARRRGGGPRGQREVLLAPGRSAPPTCCCSPGSGRRTGCARPAWRCATSCPAWAPTCRTIRS